MAEGLLAALMFAVGYLARGFLAVIGDRFDDPFDIGDGLPEFDDSGHNLLPEPDPLEARILRELEGEELGEEWAGYGCPSCLRAWPMVEPGNLKSRYGKPIPRAWTPCQSQVGYHVNPELVSTYGVRVLTT